MPPTCKLDLFVKRAVSCRKLLLKDEQRLFKLHWEQRTAFYKKHMLVQEAISMAAPQTWVAKSDAALKKILMTSKCTALRKLMLKEEQKLAKKRWELACCKTKHEQLEHGPAGSDDDSTKDV